MSLGGVAIFLSVLEAARQGAPFQGCPMNGAPCRAASSTDRKIATPPSDMIGYPLMSLGGVAILQHGQEDRNASERHQRIPDHASNQRRYGAVGQRPIPADRQPCGESHDEQRQPGDAPKPPRTSVKNHGEQDPVRNRVKSSEAVVPDTRRALMLE